MKDRLQIHLRGPGFDQARFRRFLADSTTIGQESSLSVLAQSNLTSFAVVKRFAFDPISPAGS